MKNKNLTINGKTYVFLEQQVRKLSNGKRLQITDYQVELEDGSFDYPALVCEIPENYEYLPMENLNEDCLKRMLDGVVKLEKTDFK